MSSSERVDRESGDLSTLEGIADKLNTLGLRDCFEEFLAKLEPKGYRDLDGNELDLMLKLVIWTMPTEELRKASEELEAITEPQFDGHLEERVLPEAEELYDLLGPVIDEELERRSMYD